MPTTSNFGWTTPADTDLVKDGAAAIRTLGNSIDTSLVDLKGGTTGQVLSKTSNTDMDFTWTAGGDITEVQAGVGISVASGTGPIPVITNSSTDLITTAGDLLYGTAADTVARLGIGTAGQVLKVNSGATAPEWGAVAASGKNFSLLNTGGTALTGATTITISSISGIDDLMIVVAGASCTGAGEFWLRFNSDTGSNYRYTGPLITQGSSFDSNNFYSESGNTTRIILMKQGANNLNAANGWCRVSGGNTSGVKVYFCAGADDGAVGKDGRMMWNGGIWNNSATISSVSIISNNGNFDAGTIYIYGAA